MRLLSVAPMRACACTHAYAFLRCAAAPLTRATTNTPCVHACMHLRVLFARTPACACAAAATTDGAFTLNVVAPNGEIASFTYVRCAGFAGFEAVLHARG